MNSLRIGLAQVNTTVGDIPGNVERIAGAAREAVRLGAQVVIFPEMAVSGYPPEDLLLKPHFVEACERGLQQLARTLPSKLLTLVGSPTTGAIRPYNAAVLFHGGKRLGEYRKMLLPNYGVFDEQRVLMAGQVPLVLEVNGIRLGVHICEDSWYMDGAPAIALHREGVHAVLNLSSSPYHRGKRKLRQSTLARLADYLDAPVFYCNLVGGQDELVFDGSSKVIRPDGSIAAQGPQFEEFVLVHSLAATQKQLPNPSAANAWDTGEAPVESRHIPKADHLRVEVEGSLDPTHIPEPIIVINELEEVYLALCTGLADYHRKNGFQGALVAISGGIDSALVAAIAVDALGADKTTGITLPSQYSSEGTYQDALQLAANLGIRMHNLPIQDLFDHYLQQVRPLWPGRSPDVTEENLQARIRGNIVMALSNKFGWLVLTTGNKSEMATGYCTLYGDMAGGFALIKDVPKTVVFELCRWRNSKAGKPLIPESIITRPPSAELRPDQKDSDSLPPYEILDPILEAYVEHDRSLQEIVRMGFDPAVVQKVIRLVDLSEYKRRQGAPGVKITPKAFGRDRRLPITNHFREKQ